MSISAIILTKNSSQSLEKCLESMSWCDEVIVIDDGSTDDTVSIAKKYKAKVFSHPLDNDFAKQRNIGLEKATGDWILFVDSDEIVSSSLRDEINKYTNNPINEYNGFFIKRIDWMWGRELKYGETGNMWLLRLAKKGAGKWEGKVHEVWNVKGNRGTLKYHLDHYPHPTISAFLEKINFYSTLRAQELYKKGVRVHFWDIILYPKVKFLQNYFFRLGYKDEIPGLLVALLMSFHSFLVRGKLWQMQNN